VEPHRVSIIVEEGREQLTVDDHVVRDAAARRLHRVVSGVELHQLRAQRGDADVCGKLLRRRACRETEARGGADEEDLRRKQRTTGHRTVRLHDRGAAVYVCHKQYTLNSNFKGKQIVECGEEGVEDWRAGRRGARKERCDKDKKQRAKMINACGGDRPETQKPTHTFTGPEIHPIQYTLTDSPEAMLTGAHDQFSGLV
jgi:hypothetical protein